MYNPGLEIVILKMNNDIQNYENILKQWEYRYYKSYNLFDYEICDFKSLLSKIVLDKLRFNNNIVLAISPENNYFVIVLKNLEGEIFQNKEKQTIDVRLNNRKEIIPLERDCWEIKIYEYARFFRRQYNLTELPERFLFFYPAWVRINPKKRLQRGIKISEPSYISRDLEKRNRQLFLRRVQAKKAGWFP